ncbi:MAG: PilN domain-containing protein [Vicinamibacterales bacterium]
MIRNNLSTRPFYNVSAVRGWLLAAALVVGAAMLFNVVQVLRYSNSNTELQTRAANDEQSARDLRAKALALRNSVDTTQVEAVAADARQANDLIDRRAFSWTELFNRFEKTLPDEVRITAVRPVVDKNRRIVLTVNVLARGVDDVNAFMENLDKTGAFQDLRSRQEQTTESGQIESALEMVYVNATPAAAATTGDAPAAAAASAGTPAVATTAATRPAASGGRR